MAVDLIKQTPTSEINVRSEVHPKSKLKHTKQRTGILLCLPLIIILSLFLWVPITQSIYYGFTMWDGTTAKWVGVESYVHLFKNPNFWSVMNNNGIILLSIPVAILLPLVVSFLLHQNVFGKSFFQSVYFLPTAISWVVVGMVANQVFAPNGLLNIFLKAIGLGVIAHPWLSANPAALIVVIITFIWSVFGTNTIIFFTGLATINNEVFEAAVMDGANTWTIIWRITIPLLKRFIQFALISTIITAFTGLFSLIYVMTQGGPGYGTTTLEFFMYQQAFANGEFGVGASLGNVLFVIVVIISLIQMRFIGIDD